MVQISLKEAHFSCILCCSVTLLLRFKKLYYDINRLEFTKKPNLKPAVVAELVRALVYQLKGRGFESGYLRSFFEREIVGLEWISRNFPLGLATSIFGDDVI